MHKTHRESSRSRGSDLFSHLGSSKLGISTRTNTPVVGTYQTRMGMDSLKPSYEPGSVDSRRLTSAKNRSRSLSSFPTRPQQRSLNSRHETSSLFSTMKPRPVLRAPENTGGPSTTESCPPQAT